MGKYGRKDEGIIFALKRFADDAWFGKLFPFTAFENGHRTTNSTERANRWFRKRQKSHYRVRTEPTIRRMLHRRPDLPAPADGPEQAAVIPSPFQNRLFVVEAMPDAWPCSQHPLVECWGGQMNRRPPRADRAS